MRSKGPNDTFICLFMGTAVDRKECTARALMTHLFFVMGVAVERKEYAARALMTHFFMGTAVERKECTGSIKQKGNSIEQKAVVLNKRR